MSAALRDLLDRAQAVARADEAAHRDEIEKLHRRAERLARSLAQGWGALDDLEHEALKLRRDLTEEPTPGVERQEGRIQGVLEAVDAIRRALR